MSGYLDVKYPSKSNLGLNAFKSWKRQWCILRPSPTCLGGGSLAVYSSEAGAAAGVVDLPPSSVVRFAKSRNRPYAFGIYTPGEPRKPSVLLAAPTLQESHVWLDKIQALLCGKPFGSDSLLKDSYSVSVVTTDWSRKAGFVDCDAVVTLSAAGVTLSRHHNVAYSIKWSRIGATRLLTDSINNICVVKINGSCRNDYGELKLSSPLAGQLRAALTSRGAVTSRSASDVSREKLSRSEGDLPSKVTDRDTEARRRSWSRGPGEASRDDSHLLKHKDSEFGRGLARCARAARLADDHMSDRLSLLSIASGIYEEIPDLPDDADSSSLYCKMEAKTIPEEVVPATQTAPDLDEVTDQVKTNWKQDVAEKALFCPKIDRFTVQKVAAGGPGGPGGPRARDEPAYESVAECVAVYATVRRPRRPPPPLPPRLPLGTTKMGESWNSRMNKSGAEANVTRHSSLGSLPRSFGSTSSASSHDHARTLPKPKQSFNVFRKRLKSDSRILSSPKSETAKENKDIETKKKKFDFTPTRDIFKNFKVSRKSKNKGNTLTKVGETKSCEFLDETEHIPSNRCSKSVESLEDNETEDMFDLSMEFNDDALAALALPQEIVDLIFRGKEKFSKIRLKDPPVECDYMPMSPIVPPPPIEHHYIVMSPRTNLA